MYDISIHHLVVLVLVSAVAQCVLGAIWYGAAFKKSWKAMTGVPADQKLKDLIFPAITFFIACAILSFVLIHVVTWAGAKVFTGGAEIGIVCWLGFMAPPLFAQHIWERRRANLFAINAAYWLLAMALGGGIMGAFH
jgi:hypothetical protein